jgi:NADH-quinone oxidoreductase subunit C
VPDAAGLELIAQAVRDRLGEEVVVGTSYYREQATLEVRPEHAREVVGYLHGEAGEPYDFLASLHGCDYYPEEPRLGVHYQLLSTVRVERLGVKARLSVDEPEIDTVTDLFPGANLQEREVYDFFGVIFRGHPDLRRSHMPEDYVGHPLRRDFPIGGEPVLFTFNENRDSRPHG